MQNATDVVQDDEISLMDIYDFLHDGWKTLIGMSALGLLVGVVVSLILPAQYQASALIDSGRVGYLSLETGVDSREVESLPVLAEKMKTPGFYSEQTLSVCGLAGKPNARQGLVQALAPAVGRNSGFVSVSFKAESVDAAKSCIEGVLMDVIAGQQSHIDAVINYTKREIENTQAQLESSQSTINEQRADRDQSLTAAREQLLVARQELKALDTVASDGTPASAVAAVRVLNKQGEVQQLESMLLALQSEFNNSLSERGDQINRLTNRLTALQSAIEFPNTRIPQFATPLFASDTKVAPKRSLITIISLLVGGFLGLMLLIGQRAWRHIKEHEVNRRAQATL